ncbi:MAG: ubiquitin-like small modifier protein 1 [Halobacteriota archaeon]|jgi:molybdopterin synthase sulfur carrier subunit
MGLVNVRLFANLREIVGNPHLTVEAGTIREVLTTLQAEYPALRAMLCDDDGEVRSYITILVNGKNIREIEALATLLSDGDEVAIFPPVSGG